MRPKRIIIIRHGESEANQDITVLTRKPDYTCELTSLGHEQAEKAGKEIAELINGPAKFYISPYWRTRQTYIGLRKSIEEKGFREDPRLREQEWKTRLSFDLQIEHDRDAYGPFYYRIEHGESCADTYDRASQFVLLMEREFEQPDFPETAIIVGHGMTNRILLMTMLGLTVEQFEILKNPKNCQYFIIEFDKNGKYVLNGELEKHEKHLHPYQFPWP